MIYFIQSGDGGPIKIGRAANVKQRLAAMQTATHEKLRLLIAVPGDAAAESMLHRRFRSHRIKGEWFSPDPEILAFVESPDDISAHLSSTATEHIDAVIIEALGGSAAVANLLGLPQNTVSNWKARGIAWPQRAAISAIAKKQRVKVPDDFLSVKRLA